jgi:hypothetical protein
LDDLLLLGPLHERPVAQLLAAYGAPAFVRRASRVQQAFDVLVLHCQRQRDEWLPMVRVRLAALHAMAGDWARLLPWLVDEQQLALLQEMHVQLSPGLRARTRPTTSRREMYRALLELRDSIERFNCRWSAFLGAVDLSELNRLREGYNRYYLLEKECVVRSPRLARSGYNPLAPVTVEQLTALFPTLPEFRFAFGPKQ